MDTVSTPMVQVCPKVLALPLLGVVDDHRAEQIMGVVLKRITETQSQLILLDVTGVSSMDTHVTNLMVRAIRVASLLGAQCVLTGIEPEVAQTVIQQGLSLESVVIKRDMEERLKWALAKMGCQMVMAEGELGRSEKDALSTTSEPLLPG